MNAPMIRNALMLGTSLLAAGCATLIPVPGKGIDCNPDAKLLAIQCAEPQSLPPDATFQTLVDTALADRKALTDCSHTVRALQDSIKACKQAVDEHNRRIDENNQQNAK